MNSLKHTWKATDAPESPDYSYPEVQLHGEQIAALFGKDLPEVGQVFETEVQLKVKSLSVGNDDKPSNATVCFLSIEPVEGASESDEYAEA